MFCATAQRICLALLLAIGFALPYGMLVGWINEARKELLGIKAPPSSEQILVTSEGAVMIRSVTYDDGRVRSDKCRSLDGEPVVAPDMSETLWVNQLSLEPREAFSAETLAGRVRYVASAGVEEWYVVIQRDTADGLCYFAGFDPSSRRPVGYLGAAGFQTTRPTEEQMLPVNAPELSAFGHLPEMLVMGLHNDSQPIALFLLSNGRLLKIDPQARSAQPVLERSDIVDITPVQNWPSPVHAGAAGSVVAFPILLRTPDSVLQFDPFTEDVQETPLPAELRDRDFLFYPEVDAPAVVELWDWTEDPTDGVATTCDILLLDRQGRVTERFENALRRPDGPQSRTDELLVAACAVPAPLVSLLIMTWIRPADVHSYTLLDSFADGWPALVLTCIVGGICVFLVRRRQRSCGAPSSVAWAVFVIVLGLPGYVGYRLHRRWPLREPPAAPQPNGLEILEKFNTT